MANYLIVVPRGNAELFELLSVAFRGHTGFNVVVDRRGPEASPADLERRGGRIAPGPDEIVVAERSDRVDRPATGGETMRSFHHVPVRRRRARSRPSTAAGARYDGRVAGGVATAC
jgi:hypothetical protein